MKTVLSVPLILVTMLPAIAAADEITLATDQVVSLEQTQGNPEWREGNIERLSNASFTFNDDGECIVRFPTAGGNPVLRGDFTSNGNAITFRAQVTDTTEVSVTTTLVNGRIVKKAGKPVVYIEYVSSNAVGSVVNGQKFGSHATSAYTAIATLTLAASRNNCCSERSAKD